MGPQFIYSQQILEYMDENVHIFYKSIFLETIIDIENTIKMCQGDAL